MKKPFNYSRLISALRLWITLFALVGLSQFLQWLRTSGIAIAGKDIAAFVGGSVSMGLLVAFLIHVAETLLRQRRITKQFKTARAQQAQDKLQSEEFFATNRDAIMAINELILSDAETDRPPEGISYDWINDGTLQAEAFHSWSVTLTEEQKQLFESFNSQVLFIALTPDTITYSFDGMKKFVYDRKGTT